MSGTAGSNDQTFQFNVYSGGAAKSVYATVTATTGGSTLTQVLSSLNSQLNTYGITAGTDSNGKLQFSGSTAFTVADLGNSSSSGASETGTITGAITSNNSGVGTNTSNYSVAGTSAYTANSSGETLSFQTGQGSTSVTLASNETLSEALSDINAKTASLGIYAVENSGGSGIDFQSANTFSLGSNSTSAGVLAAGAGDTFVNATAPATASTNNATSAITAINAAIANLGLVQGRVGAGENLLQYATNLAQSQISSFSAARVADTRCQRSSGRGELNQGASADSDFGGGARPSKRRTAVDPQAAAIVTTDP